MESNNQKQLVQVLTSSNYNKKINFTQFKKETKKLRKFANLKWL